MALEVGPDLMGWQTSQILFFYLQQKEKLKIKKELLMNKVVANPEDTSSLEARSWSGGPWGVGGTGESASWHLIQGPHLGIQCGLLKGETGRTTGNENWTGYPELYDVGVSAQVLPHTSM